MNYTNFIIPILGVLTILIGGAFFGWFRIVKESNNLLREQNADLKTIVADLEVKHQENLAKLGSLQGQIDVLKSIPLVNIDTTLKQIATINQSLAKSNKQILETLKSSAATLATGTQDRADKVEHVKQDLKDASPITVKTE